ncbi:MAG: 50S ribosomal protein L5 [Chlamydiae bacterium RIFCSPHIGHO2_12_FULL_27_8]|nr:MAG: 50S ribosomal protein L5 [Chlamydiae bacterium RIFCSPHIGHO2_12_FULL_27_8]OGN64926.1 MAG: 50S ribosomal protein L5 [Chlamydiae bacterium RIFCSPLOWO2_01_FULL_28_7]
MSRLKAKYLNEIKPALKNKYKNKNEFELPILKKIVISMGLNEAVKDKAFIQQHLKELSLIAGQKPVMTKSKNAVSNFKLREDQVVGLKVTLRKTRMYDFLDRFCNIVTPRIKDFRGFKPKCDGRGSYSLGIDDQQVFPEINLDEVKRTQGMNITLVTTAKTDEECIELLQGFGFPFKQS